MTARLDVTPKTTEQNRIACTSESEAEVTNNKKLRSRYNCTIDATKLTTDRHETSRGLFGTAELLVLGIYLPRVKIIIIIMMMMMTTMMMTTTTIYIAPGCREDTEAFEELLRS